MDKQESLQLELFSQSKCPSETNQTPNRAFLSYIRAYEKTILAIIGMVILSIISFSLGVEKGKRLSSLKNISRFDTASTVPESPAKIIVLAAPKKEEAIVVPQVMEGKNYVIQLASYKTRTLAQKEAESLKKKGLSPLVLSKGGYTVLYVGNFANREKALSLLDELKKRFRDCYVRRL
jgi:cell division protein FtsN